MNKENTRETYRRIISAATESELDYLWLSSPENHFYSTGFANPDGRVLVSPHGSVMLEDFRYAEQARERAIPEFEVIMPRGGMFSALREAVPSAGKVRVGYEEDSLTCAEMTRLCEVFPEAEFVPFGKKLLSLRAVKRDDEISCIIAAQKITDAAFEHIVKIITPNMTELDVAAELEYFMKKNGAEEKSFETIAVSGSHSSSPHRTPENRKLERGFLTMDFGAIVGGYHSDMTRTVCIGRADAEMRRLYDTVLSAQRAVLDVISEGSGMRETDKIARDIIYSVPEYDGTFGHSLGHGVGLEIHESPNLSPAAPEGARLVAGNVVTVEPGIYLAGKYGCRIEDMVVIREGYAEDITHAPKELIEL